MDTETIIRHAVASHKGSGVILFPAGWQLYRESLTRKHFQRVTTWIVSILHQGAGRRNVVVCLGVDGHLKQTPYGELPLDQCAIAVAKRGILAAARKFRGTDYEMSHIHSAEDHFSDEMGYQRIFRLGGKSLYLAVCYDIYGVQDPVVSNLGVDAILNPVHGFTPKGMGEGSGDADFARKGFAGASRVLSCPVFGAAVFFQRTIPPNWPSGVLWRSGAKDKRYWTYGENGISPSQTQRFDLIDGKAEIRFFSW